MFRDENIIPLTMLRRSFLDLSPFTGSYRNIRYKYTKVVNDNIASLQLEIWKEDASYDNVNKDMIDITIFDYTNEGIQKSIDYIDEYERGLQK